MNYRLDLRFILRPLGINVMTIGTLMVGAFLLPGAFGVVSAVIIGLLSINAVSMAVRPPVVVRTCEAEIRVGGRLTVRRVTMKWTEFEGVEHSDGRLFFTRADEAVLSFPLAYVGKRSDELVRDVYDRLNVANGYQTYDPS